MQASAAWPPWLRAAAVALLAILLIVLIENAVVAAYLPAIPRFATDFSPAFLQLKLRDAANRRPDVVFLGDSALWGYALPADQTAVALLARRGCACENFSFKAGGPANYYAIVRLFAAYGVRPKLVVLEIDQRVFNPADRSYRTLHPALAVLAAPLLDDADRVALDATLPPAPIAPAVDRALARAWLPYATRADLRALLAGDVDVVPAQPPAEEQFLGTYDLTPLSERNVGVRYLAKTVDLLRALDVPVVAYLTPTNHVLLHDYIDDPAYAANGAYLERFLQARGVRTYDFDRSLPAADFIDNAHLRPPGQRRLAELLAPVLGLPGLAPVDAMLGN